MDVGMIGLGLMGTAMTTRLLAAGHRVHGFDISAARRDAHVERGGTLASSVADVVGRCRLVILSLPDGDVVRQVCLGTGGALDAADEHTIIADTTTTRPELAIEVADRMSPAGATFMDVGISGNSAMVARGEALGIIGGALDAAPFVPEVLSAFCREVVHAGGPGDGMRAKLVINHILAVNRLALAEGLVLAEAMGMDPQATLSVVRVSAADSRAMDMWGARMAERDYRSPASRVRTGHKDMQLILEMAREAGAPTLGLAQAEHVARAMLATGLGDADNAVIAEMLRGLAGLAEPVVRCS